MCLSRNLDSRLGWSLCRLRMSGWGRSLAEMAVRRLCRISSAVGGGNFESSFGGGVCNSSRLRIRSTAFWTFSGAMSFAEGSLLPRFNAPTKADSPSEHILVPPHVLCLNIALDMIAAFCLLGTPPGGGCCCCCEGNGKPFAHRLTTNANPVLPHGFILLTSTAFRLACASAAAFISISFLRFCSNSLRCCSCAAACARRCWANCAALACCARRCCSCWYCNSSCFLRASSAILRCCAMLTCCAWSCRTLVIWACCCSCC
mmetsp:Transcript_13212/g.24304  ORF Transcript_13212/g.24304 Transcript_13212/m.24304 type:complete len:260 (-) Transcript_13212:1999-2778(-)